MNYLKIFLYPVFFIHFHICRFFINLNFEFSFKKKYILILLPIIFSFKIVRRVIFFYRTNFINYALKKYQDYTKNHYKKDGTGYEILKKYSTQDKRNFFLNENSKINAKSRLESVFNNYKNYINFKDGDSFLDVACGYGRDIKFLNQKFKNSKIEGFDINPNAIELIQDGLNKSNVNVYVADFSNLQFLESLENESFDWIIFSHALTFIFEENIQKTILKRKKLIFELTKKSKKGLVLLENYPSEKLNFFIEQKNRAVFNHDITKLFEDNKNGDLIMFKDNLSFCFLFKKNF
tara:strand:- start:123 stop:998 length:876 start_codon:yes stop_codon:yes gene_type:complete